MKVKGHSENTMCLCGLPGVLDGGRYRIQDCDRLPVKGLYYRCAKRPLIGRGLLSRKRAVGQSDRAKRKR